MTEIDRDTPGLDEALALAHVGRSLAAIEQDCSLTWPDCPRDSLLCDCRLRAVRAVNAVKQVMAGA